MFAIALRTTITTSPPPPKNLMKRLNNPLSRTPHFLWKSYMRTTNKKPFIITRDSRSSTLMNLTIATNGYRSIRSLITLISRSRLSAQTLRISTTLPSGIRNFCPTPVGRVKVVPCNSEYTKKKQLLIISLKADGPFHFRFSIVFACWNIFLPPSTKQFLHVSICDQVPKICPNRKW